jgi:hypothetical protein
MNPVTLDFANFLAADRIVVTTNSNRTLATVVEPQRVQSVLEVLQRHAGGWEVPAAGVPVADTRLNFYTGEKFLGNVGFARTFLTAHLRGAFWSRRVESAVGDELRGLLDLRPLQKKHG